jgi:hypothetical protein
LRFTGEQAGQKSEEHTVFLHEENCFVLKGKAVVEKMVNNKSECKWKLRTEGKEKKRKRGKETIAKQFAFPLYPLCDKFFKSV